MTLEQIIQGSLAKETVSDEERIDEAMAESFPASDSPSWNSGISHAPVPPPSDHPSPSPGWGGDWNEVKEKLKARFPNLTDEDLFYQEGESDGVLIRIQKKLGKTREEIDDLLSD